MHFNIWTVEISVAFKIIVFFLLLYMYVANSQINLFLNLYLVMIISLWNLLQYHSIVRWAIQAQWAEPLVLFLYFILSFIFFLPFSSYQSISFCFRWFRFAFVGFVFISLISFRFVSFLLISFRFVSFSLISFRFVSLRFYFVSHFIGALFFYVKCFSFKIYEKFNTIRVGSSDKTNLFWGICIQDTEKWNEDESLQTGIHKKIDW
jgi:hypothetical protein